MRPARVVVPARDPVEIVALLRELLADAEAGKLTAVAIAYVGYSEGGQFTNTAWSVVRGSLRTTVSGAVSQLFYRWLRHVEDDR